MLLQPMGLTARVGAEDGRGQRVVSPLQGSDGLFGDGSQGGAGLRSRCAFGAMGDKAISNRRISVAHGLALNEGRGQPDVSPLQG